MLQHLVYYSYMRQSQSRYTLTCSTKATASLLQQVQWLYFTLRTRCTAPSMQPTRYSLTWLMTTRTCNKWPKPGSKHEWQSDSSQSMLSDIASFFWMHGCCQRHTFGLAPLMQQPHQGPHALWAKLQTGCPQKRPNRHLARC